jgi:hypothetical protein
LSRSVHFAKDTDLPVVLVSSTHSPFSFAVVTEAAAAGELALEPAGLTPDTAAELLIASARGLESSAASPAAYRRYLSALVRVMVAGLASGHSSGAVSPPPT